MPERNRRIVSKCAPGLIGAVFLCAVLLCASSVAAQEYIVGEGDVLQINIIGHPDLATTARITREGEIRMPLIGRVYVAGIALPRIADVITHLLANGYLIDPQVSVSVHEYRILKATIIGKVNRTGVYEFRERMTLLELLSRAGGLAPDAENSAIVTARTGESRTVDLRGLLTLGNISLDVELHDGDSVFIAAAPKFTIAGEVRRPGDYRHEQGMTLSHALSLAGGLLPDADSKAVITGRSGGSRTVDLLSLPSQGGGSPEVEIQNEDSIFIAAAGRFFITGEVRRSGDYRLEEGMTILRAVTLAGGYTDHAVTDRIKVIRTEKGQERILEVGTDVAFPLRRGDIIVVSAARNEVCFVTGEVKKAGAFKCEDDTNVLKAVALAGGFTDAAAKGKIRIVRQVDGQEELHEKVGLEEPVLPGDILVIPKSFF